jgi:hypothetical protein
MSGGMVAKWNDGTGLDPRSDVVASVLQRDHEARGSPSKGKYESVHAQHRKAAIAARS